MWQLYVLYTIHLFQCIFYSLFHFLCFIVVYLTCYFLRQITAVSDHYSWEKWTSVDQDPTAEEGARGVEREGWDPKCGDCTVSHSCLKQSIKCMGTKLSSASPFQSYHDIILSWIFFTLVYQGGSSCPRVCVNRMTPRLKSEQETRRLKDYIQLLQVSTLSRVINDNECF